MSLATGLHAADSRIDGMGERRFDGRFETCDIASKDVVDVGAVPRVTQVYIESAVRPIKTRAAQRRHARLHMLYRPMLRVPRGDVPDILVIVNPDRVDKRHAQTERFQWARADTWSPHTDKQAGRRDVLSKAVRIEPTLVVDPQRFQVISRRFVVLVANPRNHVEAEAIDHTAQIVQRPRRVVMVWFEIVPSLGKEVGSVGRTFGSGDERLVETSGFDRIGYETIPVRPVRGERPVGTERVGRAIIVRWIHQLSTSPA
jgi:hypothetical protein